MLVFYQIVGSKLCYASLKWGPGPKKSENHCISIQWNIYMYNVLYTSHTIKQATQHMSHKIVLHHYYLNAQHTDYKQSILISNTVYIIKYTGCWQIADSNIVKLEGLWAQQTSTKTEQYPLNKSWVKHIQCCGVWLGIHLTATQSCQTSCAMSTVTLTQL